MLHKAKSPAPKKPRTPKLRHHKSTGQGYAVIDGKSHWLGRYGEESTTMRYYALVAEWKAGTLGRRQDSYTVAHLVADFYEHAAEQHGVIDPERIPMNEDGSLLPVHGRHEPAELGNIRRALRRLRQLYGCELTRDFAPPKLEALQQAWVDDGLTRKGVNRLVSIVKRAFKWGVRKGRVPADVWYALQSVDGLRAGRCRAPEGEPVRPVAVEIVEQTIPHLTKPVAAAVKLQLHTGARPGEILGLRVRDIRTGRPDGVWEAELEDHKTAHRGKKRVLIFGPKAQGVLKELMRDKGIGDYLIDPRDAVRARSERATVHRRENQEPSPRKTERVIGDRYSVHSYRNAIRAACTRAGVPVWKPNQLRHTAATMIRAQFGLEAAGAVLGHSGLAITEVYAEKNMREARRVVAEIG